MIKEAKRSPLSYARRLEKQGLLLLLGSLLTALPTFAQDMTPAPPTSSQATAPQVSVTGIAKTPGRYAWHRGLSVLELLAACGGPTIAPERTQATLVTRSGVEAVSINLDTLLAGTDPAQNRLLLPGDVLVLAPAGAGGYVAVTGQIARPGEYAVPKEGLPLLALLNEAGGALPSAALSRVQIQRVDTQDSGRFKFKTVDLRPMLSDPLFTAQDIRLFGGDTVLIPVRGRVVVTGAVRHGGDFSMPDGEPFTVGDALALAGGPTVDSDVDKIVIVRHHYGKLNENIRASLKDELMAGDMLFVAVPPDTGRARPRLIAEAALGATP